jgi:hypothetical protein
MAIQTGERPQLDLWLVGLRPSVCLCIPALTASLGSVPVTLYYKWDCAYVPDKSRLIGEEMTLNIWGCVVIQWHKSIRWAGFPGSRCCALWSRQGCKSSSCTVRHTCIRDTPTREAILRVDSSGLLLTITNVLSCVNQWYHPPLRLHSNTWKTTSLTHYLVNTRKCTPRRNPSVGKTPLVFNSSTCIAIAKSVHKMHVTILHVGKHKRHFYNSSQLTVTVTTRSVNALDPTVAWRTEPETTQHNSLDRLPIRN